MTMILPPLMPRLLSPRIPSAAKKIKRNAPQPALILGLVFGWLAFSQLKLCRANTLPYVVTLDTRPLASLEQAFTLRFSLTSTNGTQGNSATFGPFNVGAYDGQGPAPAPPNPNQATTLSDTGNLATSQQGFTPGDTLSFNLTLNTGTSFPDTPDRFSFLLFDPVANQTVPTDAPGNTNTLFTVDFTSAASPTITPYTTSPAYGSIKPSVTPVPEPSTLWLAAVGLAGIMGQSLWRRTQAMRAARLRHMALSTRRNRG